MNRRIGCVVVAAAGAVGVLSATTRQALYAQAQPTTRPATSQPAAGQANGGQPATTTTAPANGGANGAATRPALQPKPPEECLRVAESAYRDVINAYASQPLAWVSAQFGLAVIAENRGDWEAARAAYSAIINNKNAALGFQQQAQIKLLMVNEIQRPVLLSAYSSTQPASQPATSPSEPGTTQPALSSATMTQPTTDPTK